MAGDTTFDSEPGFIEANENGRPHSQDLADKRVANEVGARSGGRAEQVVEEGRTFSGCADLQVQPAAIKVDAEVEERAALLLGGCEFGDRSGSAGRQGKPYPVGDGLPIGTGKGHDQQTRSRSRRPRRFAEHGQRR
ncbi:hypothetical protein [Streptomyces sp. B1I3]|uniref:hypothetical protein n=1 Tax=Streptomyces sp. B1I3 TaxID=3042264 RepID=UPI0027881662|nr:hypothetical protein [Streptomyces sp. B1I3]MDQ0798078.1 hypothetical protein [Streptomyces sp. B1I3]